MSYRLDAITISNYGLPSPTTLREIWHDIESGKLPLIFDSTHNFVPGVSPVLKYSGYSDDKKKFILSIMGVTKRFFYELEMKVENGTYKKYDFCSDVLDLEECSKRVWENVNLDQANGTIKRAFTCDFESTVPKNYTKDGKAHCYLYIAITQ